MKNFKHLNFLLKNGSNLIRVSNHTTPQNGHVMVSINGINFVLVHQTAMQDNDVSVQTVSEFFVNGRVYLVKFFSRECGFNYGMILFNNIPPQVSRSQQNLVMDFSVCVFNTSLIQILPAKKTNDDSPSFAIGRFDFLNFIQQFIWMINTSKEYRIPVLWKMIVHSLWKIGYFDIFDINHFRSNVLLIFQRMFNGVSHKNVLPNLFLSFVWKLLSKNCWFMIVGDNYCPIRGSPSDGFIELFSNQERPPIVNFFDNKSQCVGLIKDEMCFLVSLETNEATNLGPLNYRRQQGPNDCFPCMLKIIFGDSEDDDSQLLVRRPAYVDTPCVQSGCLECCEGRLPLFVFKIGNSMKFFIKRADGTYECFSSWLFLLLNMFSLDETLMQLSKQLALFSYCTEPVDLVEVLVRNCGFQSIFDGRATTEQISKFLFESDFGVILGQLRREFPEFSERLFKHYLEADLKENEDVEEPSSFDGREEVDLQGNRIREKCSLHIEFLCENQYLYHLKLIFEFILERLREREDLGPEIREMLGFLDRLVKFLSHSSE